MRRLRSAARTGARPPARTSARPPSPARTGARPPSPACTSAQPPARTGSWLAAWAGSRSGRAAATVAAATAIAVLAAGCGGATGKSHPAAAATADQLPPPRETCGTSHTAINVPVIIEVEKGSASCPLAMRIQAGYNGLVRAGRVPGNGGGAPVQVDGWTCQGTDTTTTVQTGEASECHKGATEIVAVLKLQGQATGG